MKELDLSGLTALLEKATPGPWVIGSWGGTCRKLSHSHGIHPGQRGADPCVYDPWFEADNDAASDIWRSDIPGQIVGGQIEVADRDLIVAAVNNLGPLIQALTEAGEREEKLRQGLRERGCHPPSDDSIADAIEGALNSLDEWMGYARSAWAERDALEVENERLVSYSQESSVLGEASGALNYAQDFPYGGGRTASPAKTEVWANWARQYGPQLIAELQSLLASIQHDHLLRLKAEYDGLLAQWAESRERHLSAEARNADLLEGLRRAQAQFHFYAMQHAAKGTAEAAEKALTNAAYAEDMQRTIDAASLLHGAM